MRGEESVAGLCRKEGINQEPLLSVVQGFLEASKERLAGDTAREATSDEVKSPRQQPKGLLAEVLLENDSAQKTVDSAIGVAASKRCAPRRG